MKKISQLFAAIATAALVAPTCALAQLPSVQHSHDSASAKKGMSPLIDKVRTATADSRRQRGDE